MKSLICIVCPKGCRLEVEDGATITVTGQGCVRGEKYAVTEIRNPTRVLTSTIAVDGGVSTRCPVKTDGAIPKGLIFAAMDAVNEVTVCAPIAIGDVVIHNVCDTGYNVVATRDIALAGPLY